MVEILGGEVYRKNYIEKEELGRGKFGVVFKVEEVSSKNIFAAKYIKTRRREQKAKALEEISLLQKLSDPHIISLITAYENPGQVIVIMEYLDGGELFDKVADEEYDLTEADCSKFLRQICTGVEYLHSQQVVHLDLKPENIVCIDKEGTDIKIVDFGAAKKLDLENKMKVICGTPEFLSPEVVSYEFIDISTDMWSVGVICYILLSGYSPFVGNSETETSSNITCGKYDFDLEEFDIISDDAKDFISQLLQVKMKERMSATQCLSHPWLCTTTTTTVIIKTENLRRFLARRRWQMCGQAIRAMQRMASLAVKRRSSNGSLSGDNSPSVSPNTSRPSSGIFDAVNFSQEGEGAGVKTSHLLQDRLREEFGGYRRIFRAKGVSDCLENTQKDRKTVPRIEVTQEGYSP